VTKVGQKVQSLLSLLLLRMSQRTCAKMTIVVYLILVNVITVDVKDVERKIKSRNVGQCPT